MTDPIPAVENILGFPDETPVSHKAAAEDVLELYSHELPTVEASLFGIYHAQLALVEATDALAAKQHTANQIAWHAQGKAGPQVRDQIDAAVNL